MIQHTREVVPFVREIETTMPRQFSVTSESTTAAPATPIVRITKLWTKRTKDLSVVMAASY
jgi:hypothetical protein